MKKAILLVIIIFLIGCTSPPEQPTTPQEQQIQVPTPPVIQNDSTQHSQLTKNETPVKLIKNPTKDKPKIPEKPLDPQQLLWRQRIQKALAPTPCENVLKQTYPSSYYQGPLTDTHLHIPAIPDWSLEEELEPRENEYLEGRFGGPQALLGWNVKMSQITCTIKREGTSNNFAFFPVYEGEISLYLLEIWNTTMQEYPHQFTPFIMSSGNDDESNGFPTVDAQTLKGLLSNHQNLFRGYGEIGLYARENGGSPELPPDSPRLQEIYPIIKQNKLVVYFHLGDGHKESFEKVLRTNPDITFIWHGDQLSSKEIDEILSNYPNVYYGIDEFFGGQRQIFEQYVGDSKEDYLDSINKNFDDIIKEAVRDWKLLIEKHPNQVLWGTDRGDAVWNYDVEVGLMQVKIARAFIGKLKPEVQEKFAYKNAQKVIESASK